MQTPLGHDRSAPSEPLVPDEESLPAEQPIPEEEIRAEPSHDPTHIWSFYVLLAFYIRLVNPIFCMFYKLGLEVLLEIMHCIFLFQVIYIYIYIYPFLLYSLFSLLFCLWNMWFKVFHTSYTLRLCLTQEVPLPPFIFNHFWNIGDNVQLGWGENWEKKFCC